MKTRQTHIQMNRVITYGDSWAIGSGLDIEYSHPIHKDLTFMPLIPHDEIERWNEKPYVWHVAQELGCESMIRANVGKSLGVITETLLKDIGQGINNYDGSTYILDDKTLLLIMVPPDTRWYTHHEKDEENFTELRLRTEEHMNWIGDKGRYWFRYHQSMFISTIHQVLQHHNIPYLTMNNYGVFDCLKSLEPLIDWNRHLPEGRDLYTELGGDDDKRLFCGDNEHPNLKGHERIAKWIIKKITNE